MERDFPDSVSVIVEPFKPHLYQALSDIAGFRIGFGLRVFGLRLRRRSLFRDREYYEVEG